MTAQTECGHLCPMTMTNASLATLKHAPDLLGDLGAADPVAQLRPQFPPGGGEARRHHRHGHDGEAGRHRRPRQPDARRAGATTASTGITGHKWFFSAPMSDAFLVLAQAERGAHLLPDAALPARRHDERDPAGAAEGQARQPLQRLRRGRVRRRRRLAGRQRGAGDRDHPRDGDADAARLRRRERRADAGRASPRRCTTSAIARRSARRSSTSR